MWTDAFVHCSVKVSCRSRTVPYVVTPKCQNVEWVEIVSLQFKEISQMFQKVRSEDMKRNVL